MLGSPVTSARQSLERQPEHTLVASTRGWGTRQLCREQPLSCPGTLLVPSPTPVKKCMAAKMPYMRLDPLR